MVIPISLPFLFILFPIISSSESLDFAYYGFNQAQPTLTLDGASTIMPNGALRLTNKSQNIISHAFYPYPLHMFQPNFSSSSSSFTTNSSFTTSFVFSIVPSTSTGGYGFAFTMSPEIDFGAQSGHNLVRTVNSTTLGMVPNHVFAVQFDTVDNKRNQVGININGMTYVASEPGAYYVNNTDAKEEVNMESGEPIQAWIEYDGVHKLANVTISPLGNEKPNRPLISESIDLSRVLNETTYLGFLSATGNTSSSHYILGWSFHLNGLARELQVPRLPNSPKKPKSSSFKPVFKILVIVFASVGVLMLGVLLASTVYRRMMQFGNLDGWQASSCSQFRYKDLHSATKGFNTSEIIGKDGFGSVYKGFFPTSGIHVAVKKLSRTAHQGRREFDSEIEILGPLRHRNLVNLHGWCKHKKELLLVYEYMPKASLYSILHECYDNFVLSWEQRFYIIKGVASGLLYLHEELEKVVIHRDIKSSNILIDAGMNAHLGGFSLARTHGHDQNLDTTGVAGTIGYIAPEYLRSGKASSSGDVYSYGILVLEIACGRRPVEPARELEGILEYWVRECHRTNRILDVADPKLNSTYLVEEMELVLRLGLLCCQQNPDARPSIRLALHYLNGDKPLPEVEVELCSISSPLTAASFNSSPIACSSSSSLREDGR